jgi:hypothetical protein
MYTSIDAFMEAKLYRNFARTQKVMFVLSALVKFVFTLIFCTLSMQVFPLFV